MFKCSVQTGKNSMNCKSYLVILTLYWTFTCNILNCYGYNLDDALDTDLKLFDRAYWDIYEESPKRSFELRNGFQKRGCNGFPCMFTHIGGNVGNASIKKAKLMLLRECVADPSCSSIGKRFIKRSYFLNRLVNR